MFQSEVLMDRLILTWLFSYLWSIFASLHTFKHFFTWMAKYILTVVRKIKTRSTSIDWILGNFGLILRSFLHSDMCQILIFCFKIWKSLKKKNIFGNFLEKIALNQKMALITKPGNPYYLVLLENRTKPGTVLSKTVQSGDSLW